MIYKRTPTPDYPVPSTDEIRNARLAVNLTQERAAETVKVTRRAWQAWENGVTPMAPGLWLLFKLKVLDHANI